MGDHIDIAALAAACSGLGIAIDTLPRHLRAPAADDAAQPRAEDIPLALTDAEWAILAPLLPAEPPQASTLEQPRRARQGDLGHRQGAALDGARGRARGGAAQVRALGARRRLAAAPGRCRAPPARCIRSGCLHLQRIAQRAEALAGKRRRPRG